MVERVRQSQVKVFLARPFSQNRLLIEAVLASL